MDLPLALLFDVDRERVEEPGGAGGRGRKYNVYAEAKRLAIATRLGIREEKVVRRTR
jgi:hypothetical protein